MAAPKSAPTVFKGGLRLNKTPKPGTVRLCIAKDNHDLDRTELYWIALPLSSTVDYLCATAVAAESLASTADATTGPTDDYTASLQHKVKSVLVLKQHQAMQLQLDLECLSPDDPRPLSEVRIQDKAVLKWVQLPPTPIPSPPAEPRKPTVELPIACAPQHACIPSLPYLRWLAKRDPLAASHAMAHVDNFTVLHPVFGAITWMGAVDIRGLDLSEVQLSGAELLLAPGVLPVTAQVVLRAVQPRGKPPVPSFERGMAEARAVEAAREAAALARVASCAADWEAHHTLLHQACPAVTRMLLGAALEPHAAAGAAEDGGDASPAADAPGAFEAFEAQLRSACAKMGAFFVQYDPATAEWAFNVAPA